MVSVTVDTQVKSTVARLWMILSGNSGDSEELVWYLNYANLLGSCRSTIELHPRVRQFYVGCQHYSTWVYCSEK
jgi:hypothetical protein